MGTNSQDLEGCPTYSFLNSYTTSKLNEHDHRNTDQLLLTIIKIFISDCVNLIS